MIWVRRKKLLVMHVPKAAGTSLKECVHLATRMEKLRPAHMSVGEARAKFPKIFKEGIKVLAITRRPEDRATSMCRFLRFHQKDQQMLHPSRMILSGRLFARANAYTPKMGRSVCSMLDVGPTDELTVFRLEDQMQECQRWLSKALGMHVVIPKINRSSYALEEEELSKEARQKLMEEWGAEDWDRFGYER